MWVVGFLSFFFSQDLANSQLWSRGGVWLEAILDPSLLNPFDASHAFAVGVDAGWHLLPQRWPFLCIAGLLLVAAFATGTAITRRLLHAAPLSRCERFVIQAGLGLSFQSLWTLIIGSVGRLSFSMVVAPGTVSILFLAGGSLLRRFSRTENSRQPPLTPAYAPASRRLWISAGLVALPFLILLLLNGFTPPWEFDVCEYHLQGPREWFQMGRISFLEHNVYTSFPFLSEMLSLDAMVLAGDWNDGAVAAKFVLAQFQLLTMVCVFATGRRWFGTSAGLIAAVVYISVPWTLRISLIAYAEGAITFFLAASVMCVLITCSESDPSVQRRFTLITGLLAGSAMAAKYPGVVSVVIPVGWLLTWSLRTKRRLLLPTALLFGAGVLLAVGPWLARNALDTGNPVYPLMYRVFGAEDWSPEMDAKWKNGHSASEHSLANIPQHLLNVMVFNGWTSGLLFGLSVPTLFVLRSHYQSRVLWAMVFWMLATWWALTHRIDRFWIPIIPVLAVLAGAAWTIFENTCWRVLLIVCVAGCTLFNLQFWRMPELTGFQIGLMDLNVGRSLVVRSDFQTLNSGLSPQDRILMIGEAEVFDLRIPAFYNTVFDESLFEQWTADEKDDRHGSAEREMKPADAVHDVLQDHGVTHVYVNWLEILRYRGDGSYGYTEYVTPKRLRQLVEAGVLSEPTALNYGLWTELRKEEQNLILDWPGYEDLLTADSVGRKQRWAPVRLYKVR